MKKIFLFSIMLSLAWILAAAGCSRYQVRIPALPLREADLYPQEQNKDGLIVAADDYFDVNKSHQAFGVNFAKENILVIEVIVSNRSNDAYAIQSNEVLLLRDDQVIYPLLALEVSSDEQLTEYLNMVELKNVVVNPGESAHGFLYFRLPKEPLEDERTRFSSMWPHAYRLRVGATQIEQNSRLVYTISLRNM
ncbi:MAG: hypothetical protein AB1847_18715 [bacterium]